MKLLSKITTGLSFWVEDYTQQEKDFFVSLGFKESKWCDKNTLDFDGTAESFCEFWTLEEHKQIFDAVKKNFGFKKLPIKKLSMHDML
jgi:hypothetical protein